MMTLFRYYRGSCKANSFTYTAYIFEAPVIRHTVSRFNDPGIVTVSGEFTSLCNDMFMDTERGGVDQVIAS